MKKIALIALVTLSTLTITEAAYKEKCEKLLHDTSAMIDKTYPSTESRTDKLLRLNKLQNRVYTLYHRCLGFFGPEDREIIKDLDPALKKMRRDKGLPDYEPKSVFYVVNEDNKMSSGTNYQPKNTNSEAIASEEESKADLNDPEVPESQAQAVGNDIKGYGVFVLGKEIPASIYEPVERANGLVQIEGRSEYDEHLFNRYDYNSYKKFFGKRVPNIKIVTNKLNEIYRVSFSERFFYPYVKAKPQKKSDLQCMNRLNKIVKVYEKKYNVKFRRFFEDTRGKNGNYGHWLTQLSYEKDGRIILIECTNTGVPGKDLRNEQLEITYADKGLMDEAVMIYETHRDAETNRITNPKDNSLSEI